jgi:hypothetical protein
MSADAIQIKIVTKIEELEDQIQLLKEKSFRRITIPSIKNKIIFLESLELVTDLEEIEKVKKEAEEQFELVNAMKESVYRVPTLDNSPDYAFFVPNELSKTLSELKKELQYLEE